MKQGIRGSLLALCVLYPSICFSSDGPIVSAHSPGAANNPTYCTCKANPPNGHIYFPMAAGYGPEICVPACASIGRIGDGTTFAGWPIYAGQTPPSHSGLWGDSFCFLNEGASGNCGGNNWCTCGATFVHALGRDGRTITRRDGTGQETPAETVAVLPNTSLTMEASIQGCGGSVATGVRAALGPAEEWIEIENAANPVTVKKNPLPAPNATTGLSSFSQKFAPTLNAEYYVSVGSKTHFQWSGGCQYTCGTVPFAPGNRPLVVVVVEHPEPGKKYPSAYP
jgi:hypothetical protein